MIIEGVVAKRFEEKENKNEEKINFEEWLRSIRPEKDIAILGVSGTFSGCESVEEFWEAIRENTSCLSTLKNNNPDIVPISGISPNIEKFDINLFGKAGLSITEWRHLDPQIRLLAQHSYVALENSGNLERKSQIRVGCFVAAEESSPEYKQVDEREGALGSLLGMYRRNQQTFCAQWLSHLLELTGPSINVYSACSSSFSAIAQAQQALLTGEADLCLVGAVHLVHPNQIGHQPMPGQPLAKSSNSWPFCSTSDGLMRGSACAVIVLGKPIEAILRGDPILGIIKSVAINNDAGRKPNFMSPSIEGQQAVIERALEQSGVPRNEIPFWECHAAGTTIGDNIELSAIYKAFFKEKTEKEENNNLFVGSCKSNIGHCFAASGICSIIKLLKMLETGLLPPQLLPNNDVMFADLLNPFNGQLIIHSGSEAKEILPSKINAPLYFGSSNFGIGGTNGAVIILSGLTNNSLKKAASEWRKDNKNVSEINKGLFNKEATKYRLFPISAESKNSLREFASNLAEYIREFNFPACLKPNVLYFLH
uniref:Ketosynthase family 3 (KS3) domain-containing protein n=1 Tax=Meloidogyne incognita TaxID=6306 RepID=A0A914L6M3_MELIC